MLLKTPLILLLLLCSICLYSQSNTQEDSTTTRLLNNRFKDGEDGFSNFFGNNLRYPMKARLNCRIGVVFTTVKIHPSGDIDSIEFKNDIELGMGLEDEVKRCLLSTKGRWLKAKETTTLTFSVAFHMDEAHLPHATVIVVAYGLPVNGCPTNKELIQSFETAKNKNKNKEAIELCQDLIRRIPTSDTYKQELAALTGKNITKDTTINKPIVKDSIINKPIINKPISSNPLLFNITSKTPIIDKTSKKQITYNDYAKRMRETPADYICEPVFDAYGQASAISMREKTKEERDQNQAVMLADPTKAPKIGEFIKPFVMVANNGETFDSEKLADKVVILYFMLNLTAKTNDKFANDLKQVITTTSSKGAIWIGLSGESIEEVQEFTEKEKPNFNIVPYSQGFQIRYSAFTTPSFIVISKQGKVAANITDIRMDNRLNELKDVIMTALK